MSDIAVCPQPPASAAHLGVAESPSPRSPADSLRGRAWSLDTFSTTTPEVTLRDAIAMIARMRADPLIAGVRRQRYLARLLGSAGGWLCVGGVILCVLRHTPDAAGAAALAVGVGCTIGGGWQMADSVARLLRQDPPRHAAVRRERLELLRDLADQLPVAPSPDSRRGRAFAAIAQVVEAMHETVSTRPETVAWDTAMEAGRGWLGSSLAGSAAGVVLPWVIWWGRVMVGEAPARQVNVVLSVAAALTGAALATLVAATHRATHGAGAWRSLRRIADRRIDPERPVYGLAPDLVLRVRLPWYALDRLFGDASADRPLPEPAEREDLEQPLMAASGATSPSHDGASRA